MEELKKVKVGDKIRGRGHKRAMKVLSRSKRFIIMSKPFNPRKTFQYSIIDLKTGMMGPDNRYGERHDYLTIGGAKNALKELESGVMELSGRRSCKIIKFDKIEHLSSK